jgi:hypothetical protein
MTITYEEFDSTPATLLAALKTKILSNPHWSDQGVVNVSTTSTGATSAAGNTVTLTSAAGFTVGSFLTAGVGTANENTFQITAVAGAVVTVSGTWGVIYPSGNTFRTRNTVLKSTSDRGAALIVDLENGYIATNFMGIAAYRAYTGTAQGGQTDMRSYSVYWKAGSGTATMPIHVTLSVGKNHLFFAVEGPRPSEPSTSSTTYGSLKSYFAMSDLIPYHAADTIPAVVAIGSVTYSPSVSAGGHQCQISRDSTNAYSWSSGRLGTLAWPTMFATDYVTMPRNCTIDGNSYLFPYVLFSEMEGIRGRLSSFFYAGGTQLSTYDYPDPVGTKITFDGLVYKLVAVNRGDGSFNTWGPFGSITQSTAPLRSLVVAVPFAVAV